MNPTTNSAAVARNGRSNNPEECRTMSGRARHAWMNPSRKSGADAGIPHPHLLRSRMGRWRVDASVSRRGEWVGPAGTFRDGLSPMRDHFRRRSRSPTMSHQRVFDCKKCGRRSLLTAHSQIERIKAELCATCYAGPKDGPVASAGAMPRTRHMADRRDPRDRKRGRGPFAHLVEDEDRLARESESSQRGPAYSPRDEED